MYEDISLSHMENDGGSTLFQSKTIHLLPAIMASLIKRTLNLPRVVLRWVLVYQRTLAHCWPSSGPVMAQSAADRDLISSHSLDKSSSLCSAHDLPRLDLTLNLPRLDPFPLHSQTKWSGLIECRVQNLRVRFYLRLTPTKYHLSKYHRWWFDAFIWFIINLKRKTTSQKNYPAL